MSENIVQYVNAAAAGDTDAMAKLYSKTLKGSYFLATKLCTVEEQAVNITKAAYARAFSNIEKLKKPEAFEIWLKQTVAAVYKEGVKFVFGDADAGAQESSSEFLPEDALEDEEKLTIVDKAVSSLKPELKTAIILHYNNGMPVPALAKFLGVSESTANALLGKARAEILSLSALEASPSEPSGTLPVLTRIFQKLAVETKIENSVVRDIFIYAMDAYENSKPVPVTPPIEPKAEEEAAAAEEEIKEEPAEEKAEETAAEEAAPAEEPAQPDNVIDFKQRINDILSAPAAPAASEETEEEAEEEAVVPEFKPAPVPQPEYDNNEFAARNHESVSTQKENKKPVNTKTIVIAVAALAIIIALIAGISKLVSKDDTNTDNPAAGTTVGTEDTAAFKWVAGGFEECTEIEYLDENCASFKSVTTGKYGLIDYQGNVILQPNYDGFVRCGNGKDYTNKGSYHSLVVIGNENYEFTVDNGVVTISETPHGSHGVDADPLGNTSYDERDRYFNGYAAARKDGLWGYVSQDKDKRVIKYQYEAVNDLESYEASSSDYCRPVSDTGLIPVKKDGMMGIINLDNDVIANFEYSNILPGSNGVFIACKAGTWGVILTGNAINSFAGVNITVENVPSDVPSADEPTEGRFVVVDPDGANVRSDAGSDYDLLGELDEGDIVEGYAIKEADNGKDWLCIKYNGEFGWVSMAMLEEDGI